MEGNKSKLFRVSKDNSENIRLYAKRIGKTESYVINKALRRYFSNQPAVEKLSEPVTIDLSKSMLAFFEQEKNKYGHSRIQHTIMNYLYIGLRCAGDYEEFKMEFESMDKQRIYDFWRKMDDEETCRKFNLTMQELKDTLKEFGV